MGQEALPLAPGLSRSLPGPSGKRPSSGRVPRPLAPSSPSLLYVGSCLQCSQPRGHEPGVSAPETQASLQASLVGFPFCWGPS